MKFSYYADLYLKFGKKEWKNSTFVKNAGIVANRLHFFENMEISDIKPSVIRVWLDGISDVCNEVLRGLCALRARRYAPSVKPRSCVFIYYCSLINFNAKF